MSTATGNGRRTRFARATGEPHSSQAGKNLWTRLRPLQQRMRDWCGDHPEVALTIGLLLGVGLGWKIKRN
jgi:hypothetical protein